MFEIKGQNMKIQAISIFLLSFIIDVCNAQSADSLRDLNWKPYGILKTINESPLLTLDTNGFTFQFGFNSVLANIYEYYHTNKNTLEDSLLLSFMKSIGRESTKININTLEYTIKKRMVRHIGDLMSKGNCKIINSETKEVISKIACLNYLKRDNSGGIVFNLIGKSKAFENVLEIETEYHKKENITTR